MLTWQHQQISNEPVLWRVQISATSLRARALFRDIQLFLWCIVTSYRDIPLSMNMLNWDSISRNCIYNEHVYTWTVLSNAPNLAENGTTHTKMQFTVNTIILVVMLSLTPKFITIFSRHFYAFVLLLMKISNTDSNTEKYAQA